MTTKPFTKATPLEGQAVIEAVLLVNRLDEFPSDGIPLLDKCVTDFRVDGYTLTLDARHRFSVKFYLVGMLFILFDIEAIFLYPWVVVYRDLNHGHSLFGFLEMLIFVILILSGFFYIWKKGALDWAESGRTGRKL